MCVCLCIAWSSQFTASWNLPRRALRVFRKLANPLAAGAMPMVTGLEILAAEGIAFTFVQKAGAGLYGMGGHGFVIRKACPP